ncbi:MAG: hypothetical protein AAF974_01285 [Cyanobacteria bacterium P01_E01_bin.34]
MALQTLTTTLVTVLSLVPTLFIAALFNAASAQVPSGIDNGLFDRPDFFEDGLDLMEDEIRRLEDPEASQPTLTVQDELLQWQPTVVPDAGLGVLMPQGVTTEETELLDTEDGELAFSVLASEVASARYLVAHSSLSDAQQQFDTQLLLEQVRDSIVDRTNYQLSGDRAISLDNRYPGREFSIVGNGEQLTFRTYAIGNQLVVLAGGQPEVQQDSQAVETFLGSLQLLQ